jgi:Skp family chaperone for outer membrane proteins
MAQIPKLPAFPADALRPVAGPRQSGAAAPAQKTSPAFEALLERLTARAAEVEEKSKTLASPGELPEALDAARASLADALKLGGDLLEAFRAAQQGREVEP